MPFLLRLFSVRIFVRVTLELFNSFALKGFREMFTNNTLDFFFSELESSKPAPGGGSAAAATAATGAALAGMVCNFTIGKKKFAEFEEELGGILARTEKLREKLASAVDRDTEAYNLFSEALSLPKDTDEEKAVRKAAMQQAARGAMEVPREVVSNALAALREVERIVEIGNPNLITDAGCSALFLLAGLRGARLNVLINLPSLGDEDLAGEVKTEVNRALEKAVELEKKIMQAVDNKV